MSFVIPKDLWISLVTIHTLKEFSSSLKILWEQREFFAKRFLEQEFERMHISNDNGSWEILEYYPKLSPCQFVMLLHHNKYFHKTSLVVNKCLFLYLKCFDIRLSCKNLIVKRKTESGMKLAFLPKFQQVTFYYKPMTKEDKLVMTFGDRNNSIYFTIFDDYQYQCYYRTDIISYTKRKCFQYIRAMVLQAQSAECIIPHVQVMFPIFPSHCKLHKYKLLRDSYVPFFKLIFNNKTIVDIYFERLQQTRTLEQGTDTERFLYFMFEYGTISDLALLMYTESACNMNKEYLSSLKYFHFEYII